MTLQDLIALVDTYQEGGLTLAHHRLEDITGIAVHDDTIKFLRHTYEEGDLYRQVNAYDINTVRMNQPAKLVDPQGSEFVAVVRGWVLKQTKLTYIMVSATDVTRAMLIPLDDPGWQVWVKPTSL